MKPKKKTKPFPKSTQEPTSTRFCTISNLSWTAADGHAHIRERTLAHLGEHRGHSRARAHAHLRKGPRGWLCYYNNTDVAPGLQAMEKMRDFCNEKRIDIQKLSIPGVRLHYLLHKAVERGVQLYSSDKEKIL